MPWLEIFSGSLAISMCVTLLVCRAAVAANLLDQPLETRKIHVRPVPRLGGVGIVAGVYGSLLLGVAFIPALRAEVLRHGADVLALAVGGVAIAGLGLYDDLHGANARTKFAAQCCVALLLYAAGFRIVEVENPFGGDITLGAFSLPLTLLWIVGVTNAINLIDGLDGLAGGVAVAAASALAVTAAQAGDVPAMVITVALIGALIGFLVFNVNPASIFMGDTGSLFLGALLAALAIVPRGGTDSSPLLASAVVLGIPIADTLLAIARRSWRGAPLFSADRGHLHHRLLDRGFSQRGAALSLWLAAGLLAAAGAYVASRAPGGALLLALVVVAGGLFLHRAGMFEFLREAPKARALRTPVPGVAPASATRGAGQRANILGYGVTTSTIDACVKSVLRWTRSGGHCRCVECINPHSYAVALKNERFREALRDADTLLPDGSGIVLAARWLKQPITCRVTGSDLFRGVMEAMDRRGGGRVFFLGATEATLATIRERVRAEFPHAVLAGTYSPPFTAEFTAEESQAMIDAVNAAHADVLWVGMTAPKQEIWLHENHGRLNVKMAGAIGAVFDFYAGKVKRSPRVFQQLGLEWLPRLLQQPRRLWRRTFVSAPIFLWHTLRSAAAARRAAPAEAPRSAGHGVAAVSPNRGFPGLLPTPIRSGRAAVRPSRMRDLLQDAPAEVGENRAVHAALVQPNARSSQPANLQV